MDLFLLFANQVAHYWYTAYYWSIYLKRRKFDLFFHIVLGLYHIGFCETQNIELNSATCPKLSKPTSGYKKCFTRGNNRTCKGWCLPTYRFPDGTKEIQLTCENGAWYPINEEIIIIGLPTIDQFPQCVSDGSCQIQLSSKGKSICTISKRGKFCDVECEDDGYKGQHWCGKGNLWKPPLRGCATTSNYYATTMSAALDCLDPGNIENGHRENPIDKAKDFTSFPAGTVVDYFCDVSYVMEGKKSIVCLSTGEWSNLIPECVMSDIVVSDNFACGVNRMSLKVGERTKAGDWPWQVAIFYEEEGYPPTFICGGALISSNIVLTAAHCITGKDRRQFTLFFGRYYRDSERENQYVIERVPKEIFAHPQYNSDTFNYDFAIIRFTPIEFSKVIHPICLPSVQSTEQNVEEGRIGYVVGWDKPESNQPSEILILTGLPVVSRKQCVESFSVRNVSITITDNMFCAGHKTGGIENCRGVAGEPMAFRDLRENRFVLEGLVSFGLSDCSSPETYTVYARVSTVLDWIREHACRGTINILSAIRSFCMNPLRDDAINMDPTMSAALDCLDPGNIENGHRDNPIDKAKDFTSFPAGTVVEYFCDVGYVMEGEQSLVCLSTREWSNPTPKCVMSDIADSDNVACGVNRLSLSERIHYGEYTKEGEWPWQVAIFYKDKRYPPKLMCGGALISSNIVLTAAHCISGRDRQNFTLFFGKYYRDSERDNQYVIESAPIRIFLHPKFNNDTFDYDFAIIRFTPVEFSEIIHPICLPSLQSSKRNIKEKRTGYVVGWGETETDRKPSEILLLARLPVVSRKECVESSRNVSVTITDNMFCAGHKTGGIDTCRGDSGGPIAFLDSRKHQFVLEGLVSFGPERCGSPEQYAVYARVSTVLDWIWKHACKGTINISFAIKSFCSNSSKVDPSESNTH